MINYNDGLSQPNGLWFIMGVGGEWQDTEQSVEEGHKPYSKACFVFGGLALRGRSVRREENGR